MNEGWGRGQEPQRFEPHGGVGSYAAQIGRDRRGCPIEGVDGNWRCTECGNINFGKREKCNRCSAPRPAECGTGGGGNFGGRMGGGSSFRGDTNLSPAERIKHMALGKERPIFLGQVAILHELG